ncbi:Gfo/Idh/MocA family oxidoreductase [Helcobacillus massiliensis]|uniref:Gfo/Idh/MocA family oxidoreductase n=1 Tax=Helcobacillus massiliensis TaxID=521392 RepID=UPI0025572741|nr:Gfo/Idh/MocA family oxidoreductase [Helcobacillus massiliensis]MDK7741931.1 Gfo/Idh/MocA family oxidoreductase [Helcobacillus massiliensis]WOO93158.1 Gfo/Idh/MocA family oxidoreductase [Helcobacillus massiliensis]
MADNIRVAVVGLGSMAQSVHLPMILRRHDRFETVAIVDISERRRQDVGEKWRLGEDARFASVQDLMAAVRARDLAVDAVVYAADGVKADDVLAIIKRGIHVLLEPPVGYGAEEINRIAEFERMTGRSLVTVANAQAHDQALVEMEDDNTARDLRIIEFETLMPAMNALYGNHHVTSAAYDLPFEERTHRREAMDAALEAAAGPGANQRDRDLLLKGILSGLAVQLGVLRSVYGAMTELHAVRQWPETVTPGSFEVLGALEDGARVRMVWHYLPFAPQLRDSIRFVGVRRQGRVDLPNPADLDVCGRYSVTQKTSGKVVTTEIDSEHSPAYAMYEAFAATITEGAAPRCTVEDALLDAEVARTLLAQIAEADGRDIDHDPDADSADDPADGRADNQIGDGADDAAEPMPAVEDVPEPIDAPENADDSAPADAAPEASESPRGTES